MKIEEAEVYTVDEAAKFLKISRSTILRRISDGILPSLKMGRIRRISGKDILEFLEKSRDNKEIKT